MYTSPNDHFLEHTISLGLILLYCIFYINLVIDDGIIWSLIYIPITLTILLLIFKKKIILDKNIFIYCISGFLFITLNEIILHRASTTEQNIHKINQDKTILQFFYIIPLLLIPNLFRFCKFDKIKFFNIIIFSTIISFFFNLYWNIKLNFDRHLLIERKFDLIILYDFTIISLSIISLIYSIKIKNLKGYAFISLSLLNLLLIISHGSRGTWVGIPIILILITIIYYKKHSHRILFILSSLLISFIISINLPNSPISKRLNEFQNDKNEIQKNNNFKTSTGERLTLWKLSIKEFSTSPLVGVGKEKFEEDICDLSKQGYLTKCYVHSHNLFMHMLANYGLLGLFYVILIFFIPLIVFCKNLFNPPNQLVALTGICVIIYTIMCSLTDYFITSSFPTLFFYLTIISLMSLINSRKVDNCRLTQITDKKLT